MNFGAAPGRPSTLLDRINEAKSRHANSGGPASRRRSEHVALSVLGDDAPSLIRLPRVIRVAVHFGPHDPFESVLGCMARRGIDDAEQLRQLYPVPMQPLLARPAPDARWGARFPRSSDDAILAQAVLLGLCTAYQFDPSRPVLWTRASLTRRLELFDAAEFYA